MIRIITDSSCDLPQELIDKYNIDILPLRVNLGENSYADRKEINPDQIFAWADENKDTPKTSVFSIDTPSYTQIPISIFKSPFKSYFKFEPIDEVAYTFLILNCIPNELNKANTPPSKPTPPHWLFGRKPP